MSELLIANRSEEKTLFVILLLGRVPCQWFGHVLVLTVNTELFGLIVIIIFRIVCCAQEKIGREFCTGFEAGIG